MFNISWRIIHELKEVYPKGQHLTFTKKNCTQRCAIFSLKNVLTNHLQVSLGFWFLIYTTKLVTRKQPRLSPTICESLRMRPKALQVRACVWDGRVWWTQVIQGHPHGKEKSILNAYVWLHPRRFWSDLATAFSLWFGCSTTTIYILKRVRTPILDFLKKSKIGVLHVFNTKIFVVEHPNDDDFD